MEIPRSFLLFLVLISIISIAFGVLTISNVVSRFDGVILAKDGSVLDIDKFLTSPEGQDYMVGYISNYIKPQGNMYKLDSSNVQFDGWNFNSAGKLVNGQSTNYNFIMSSTGLSRKGYIV